MFSDRAEYLRNAKECRQKARTAVTEEHRQAWLKMAENWDALARHGGERHSSESLHYFDDESGHPGSGQTRHEPPTE